MYICYNCNQLSDESDLDYVSNLYGEFYKRERVCPYCKSTDIYEAVQCDCCEKYYNEDQCERGLCENCKEEALSDWHIIYEAEKQIGDGETIYVNPFIYDVMGEDAIQEIIEKAFLESMRLMKYGNIVPNIRGIGEDLFSVHGSDYVELLPAILAERRKEKAS